MRLYLKFILILLLFAAYSCSNNSQDSQRLVACTTSDDCNSDLKCIDGFCQKEDYGNKNECNSDLECPKGFYCNQNNKCENIKCNSREDCDENMICLNGSCMEGCDNNSDCKSTQKCNLISHQCENLGDCTQNPEICTQGYYCDELSGKCLLNINCQTNNDCAPGYKCDSGACIEKIRCNNNDICPDGEVCRTDGYCDVDTGCDSDQYCINKNPAKPACSTISGICYECVTNEHCNDLSKPNCNQITHQCQAEEGPNGECQADSDCGMNQRCNTSVTPHECIDMMATCHSDADCQNGMHCKAANERCVMCTQDSHCTAPKTCNPNTNLCEENGSSGGGGSGGGSGGGENGVCASALGILSCLMMGGECQGEDCIINEDDPCENVDCPENSTCNNGICECDYGYHESEGVCKENETCNNVTCPDNSHCVLENYEAHCYCNEGYTATDTDGDGKKDTCSPQNPCDGINCSGHGICTVNNGNPICNCDAGYHANGLYCVEDAPTCELDSLSTPLNNTSTTAKTINFGNYDNLTLSDSNCRYTEDWYKIQLNSDTIFKFVLTYRETSSNITVKLYKQSDTSNPIASNTATQYTREINYTVTQSGTYFIRVYIYYQSEQRPISYSMTLSETQSQNGNPADTCNEDSECFGDNSFCAKNYTSSGYCTANCTEAGTTCMDNGVCDGKYCFKKCTADGEDQSCERDDLVCQDYHDGAGPVCVAKCFQNSDCSTNYCVNGHCRLHYMNCNLNDPFNDGCQIGEFCTTDSNNRELCYPNGTGEIGAPCEWTGDCREGLACIGNESNGYYCTELCKWSSDCLDDSDLCYAFGLDSDGNRQYRFETNEVYGYCD